jgi:hypothetical protein
VFTPRLQRTKLIGPKDRKGWMALGSGLLIGLQLLALVHLSLARHTTCEHGGLVEADGKSQALTALIAVAPQSGAAIWVSDDSYEAKWSTTHEHCVVYARRRDAVAVPQPLWNHSTTLVSLRHAPLVEQSQGPCRALFRLAPKQSPPLT